MLGVVVAALAVTATTLLIYPLRNHAPVVSTSVLYLLAVLLVSTYWGFWLGLLTAIASAATFNWFHLPPTGRFAIAQTENWVALLVFLAAAALTSTVSDVARSRAAEAERRREEADLALVMARVLLGGATLDEALPRASEQLSAALDLPFSEIVLDQARGGDRITAVPLDAGRARSAALLVPTAIGPEALERLRERVVPSLEALLRAALDREELQGEVVEAQALRRSDVIKTALLRAVSHDLRSPLTAIIAAGEAVGSPAIDPVEREELAASIRGEATRLSRLVEKLLDLSRLQAGEAEPHRDWVSIEELVRAAADELEEREPATEVRLSVDPELPLVRADAAQLERVFANLLENALRYGRGHPVQVRAREVNGRLVVRVVDRGPGIPQAQLRRIFEPFHRADAADGHHGSGLGLAIVRGFVEANGGRVWAESLPGQGTVFVIELPLEQQRAEAPA